MGDRAGVLAGACLIPDPEASIPPFISVSEAPGNAENPGMYSILGGNSSPIAKPYAFLPMSHKCCYCLVLILVS